MSSSVGAATRTHEFVVALSGDLPQMLGIRQIPPPTEALAAKLGLLGVNLVIGEGA